MDNGTCRKCGAAILWGVMASGRKMPINIRGELPPNLIVNEQTGHIEVVPPGKGHYISHFATCPEAKEFRRK